MTSAKSSVSFMAEQNLNPSRPMPIPTVQLLLYALGKAAGNRKLESKTVSEATHNQKKRAKDNVLKTGDYARGLPGSLDHMRNCAS